MQREGLFFAYTLKMEDLLKNILCPKCKAYVNSFKSKQTTKKTNNNKEHSKPHQTSTNSKHS